MTPPAHRFPAPTISPHDRSELQAAREAKVTALQGDGHWVQGWKSRQLPPAGSHQRSRWPPWTCPVLGLAMHPATRRQTTDIDRRPLDAPCSTTLPDGSAFGANGWGHSDIRVPAKASGSPSARPRARQLEGNVVGVDIDLDITRVPTTDGRVESRGPALSRSEYRFVETAHHLGQRPSRGHRQWSCVIVGPSHPE